MNFSDPSVQAAIISGSCTIISSLIAAIAASIIGKKISGRERLKELLSQAIDDIAFLLEVEDLHCERNKENSGQAFKNITRDEARNNGYEFSTKFTRGRARSLQMRL